MADNATATVAQYIAGARLSDLPGNVQHEAQRTLLNFIGCAVGGARDDSVNAAVAALARFSGPASATVLGRGEQFDPFLAALLNGMSSAVYSFDDTHAQAVVHPGGPVACAMLAYAEANKVSGRDFLLAYVLGIEVVCRISKAISVAPATGNFNWVQTGICGGIGAAAAVGKLLNLSPHKLAWAMGNAATQAGGIRGLSKSMCFALMAGQAAQSGLKAALLAEQGFTSADDPIGMKLGFADSYAAAPNMAAFTDGLGTHFEILANTYKPYPCGVVIHPVIDACLDLIRARPLDPTEVECVDVYFNPTSASLADIPDPKDPSQAQMSTQHWVAAAICDRAAGVRQSRTDKLSDPLIARLRDAVRIVADDGQRRESARLSVQLRGGEVLESVVETCRGSERRPMTDQEIEDKFRTQCAGRLATGDIDAAAKAVWSLTEIADCAVIALHAAGQA